jgi:hypothetical protein
MKDDEVWFLLKIYRECENAYVRHLDAPFPPVPARKTPRDLINEEGFPVHYKRAWYLLEKWSDKDWYNYGVTLDLGWLEEEGMKKAEELINEGQPETSSV